MVDFGKVMTAMVTPFKDDLSVDYKKAEELAVYLANNGSDSLVIHGTTGESPTLTHEEEYELYRVVKAALTGAKCKLIAGTGSNSTSTTVNSTKQAEKIGCDGAMVVVPYYNKPSAEGLYQHFKAVAEATGLPLIIYNIPGRTGINMLPETVARVAQIKNYVGLKDAAGNLDQTSATRAACPDRFAIWSGDDSLTLPMLAVGAIGVISVASHLVGPQIAEMVNAYHAGDIARAKELHLKLLPLFKVLFITANPTPVKAALAMVGRPVGIPRLPLIEAGDKEKDQIRSVLKGLKLI
ncbi:4-hydroxy-tetrahydrodipicolinate synthase [Candidatus Saganbacteria bacterium]|nr:4-hydroxy-tetrahydrodipicolinate synthase [Candidatus Saganbacteria bacterium]